MAWGERFDQVKKIEVEANAAALLDAAEKMRAVETASRQAIDQIADEYELPGDTVTYVNTAIEQRLKNHHFIASTDGLGYLDQIVEVAIMAVQDIIDEWKHLLSGERSEARDRAYDRIVDNYAATLRASVERT